MGPPQKATQSGRSMATCCESHRTDLYEHRSYRHGTSRRSSLWHSQAASQHKLSESGNLTQTRSWAELASIVLPTTTETTAERRTPTNDDRRPLSGRTQRLVSARSWPRRDSERAIDIPCQLLDSAQDTRRWPEGQLIFSMRPSNNLERAPGGGSRSAQRSAGGPTSFHAAALREARAGKLLLGRSHML